MVNVCPAFIIPTALFSARVNDDSTQLNKTHTHTHTHTHTKLTGIMRDIRESVEQPVAMHSLEHFHEGCPVNNSLVDAMTTIRTHHRYIIQLRVLLNLVTDISIAFSWMHCEVY